MNRLTTAVAVAGWVLFGFSVLVPRSSDADAQAEIARLSRAAETASADRDALSAELERLKAENGDLQHVQKRSAATTQELEHLEYLRTRLSAQIDTIRPQASEGPGQAADPEETASPQVSPAPPTEASLTPSKAEISNAQQALTALGFGPLKADGVFDPGTRRAIEAFQREQGLPATGQLGADTLKAINES